MRSRTRPVLGTVALAVLAAGAGVAAAQGPGPVRRAGKWVVPRAPDGHPDLQGNWTNGTITPVERPSGQERALTKDQVVRLEKIRADTIEKLQKDSDPNRPAPPKGGDGTVGAAGMVGGYNYFWIDAGDRVAAVNGEFRSSLIIDPPNGKIPPLIPAARARFGELAKRMTQFGEYDNPENRPLAERCLMSFGSNAGPPMLPNYFYNNNYTIVQTKDHVVILTEMVHDARIIPLGKNRPHLPKQLRPWMGDSNGWWLGDTLVVETTNIHPQQSDQAWPPYSAVLRGGENVTVTERFHRADPTTILYRFTVADSTTYTQSWSGEVPFKAMPDLIYEYGCHEGNYAIANVLSGARAGEREAAKKTQER